MQLTREKWNQIASSTPGGSFLQSWEWGELQRVWGGTFWRLQADAALALVVRRALPLGMSWLYVPRGPITKDTRYKLQDTKILDEVVRLGREQKSIFILVEPPLGVDLSHTEGWRPTTRLVQPLHTAVLNLTSSEDELLAAMHQKTRYNIRLAEKRGVTTRFSRDVADVEHFVRLSSDVTGRAGFHYHPPEYYRALIQTLGQAPPGGASAELALAEYQGTVVAAHILVSFAGMVTYLHGASSSQHREVMAPQLLQWESIKRAKAAGATSYDFYGVAPADASGDHPWAGITRFKLGFGAQRISYPSASQYVLDRPRFLAYQAMRALRAQ